MQRMIFQLHITAEQYQRYYQGSAKAVIVQTEDGRKLQFPANRLQKFVGHEGIHGRFQITFDNNHKIIDLSRC
ncbi:MAG: DUF2835 family protein [Gammaproteobacteria bacterium]|nr:MAG: DUF2835 family protein [Gammaproteobacteria bacterium]